MNNEHKDHKISLPNFDFERTSYISETDLEKDIDESNLPSEMQRLLAMEDKQILPHQEVTELVNIGTDNEKKEVKIGFVTPQIRDVTGQRQTYTMPPKP